MEPNYIIGQEIAQNAMDEQEAIKGYYKLLTYPRLRDEHRAWINEIIAEEKKHAYMLAIMEMYYDGEIKAEELPDDAHIGLTITRDEEHEGHERGEHPEEHRPEEME